MSSELKNYFFYYNLYFMVTSISYQGLTKLLDQIQKVKFCLCLCFGYNQTVFVDWYALCQLFEIYTVNNISKLGHVDLVFSVCVVLGIFYNKTWHYEFLPNEGCPVSIFRKHHYSVQGIQNEFIPYTTAIPNLILWTIHQITVW